MRIVREESSDVNETVNGEVFELEAVSGTAKECEITLKNDVYIQVFQKKKRIGRIQFFVGFMDSEYEFVAG